MTAPMQQGYAQLGNLHWRVDPTNVTWKYQLDVNRIETLGGQVVQVVGATLSDLMVTGDLGQDHGRRKESWQLANAFHDAIKKMMDAQVLNAKTVNGNRIGAAIGASVNPILNDVGFVHDPLPFTYQDGVHDWTFQVLIKGIADGDGSGSITYSNGKFNHTYQLSLFIVQAGSDLIKTIASDEFLSRIAEGVGWKQTEFNGPLKMQEAQDFILANGGTINALLTTAISGQPLVLPAKAGGVLGAVPGKPSGGA